MDILWFEKTPKGRGNAASDRAFKITFTDKPKGVRCNVALTRKLAELGADFVKMGLQDNIFLIKPIIGSDPGFKLITNKSSAQVCAASIGEWAVVKSLIKKRAIGSWDSAEEVFVFDLVGAIEDSSEEELEIEELEPVVSFS
ncbi:MAG: hypothetical protein FD169_1687 [Bacillota bacterium]|nr:MAG: hypothetical protein FD169_1687 [Bacillota bacterium]